MNPQRAVCGSTSDLDPNSAWRVGIRKTGLEISITKTTNMISKTPNLNNKLNLERIDLVSSRRELGQAAPRATESVAILIDYENVSGVGAESIWNIVEQIAETEHVGIVNAYANWNSFPKARWELETQGIIPTNMPTNCSCLLYTSPSPRDQRGSRMPSSA